MVARTVQVAVVSAASTVTLIGLAVPFAVWVTVPASVVQVAVKLFGVPPPPALNVMETLVAEGAVAVTIVGAPGGVAGAPWTLMGVVAVDVVPNGVVAVTSALNPTAVAQAAVSVGSKNAVCTVPPIAALFGTVSDTTSADQPVGTFEISKLVPAGIGLLFTSRTVKVALTF